LKGLIREYLSQDESEFVSKEAQENLRKSVRLYKPFNPRSSSSLGEAFSSVYAFFKKPQNDRGCNPNKSIEMKEF
jgi:hypothetical protein